MEDTNIFDGLPQEGEKLEVQETETPAASSPESNQAEQSPPSQGEPPHADNTENEENIPFHRHPRWKALQEEKKQIREENEQLRKSIEDLLPLKEEVERLKTSVPRNPLQENQHISVPDWFVNLYGDNPEAYAIYQRNEQQRIAEERQLITRDVLTQIEQQQKQRQEEQEKYSKIFEQQFKEIGEEHNVDLSYQEGKNSLRNEFTDFINKNPIYDQNGLLNLKLGWQFFKSAKQPVEMVDKTKSIARKQIAAQTVVDTKSEVPEKDYVTPNDIRKSGWRNYLKP